MEQITLDILWNRLVATVNEQAAALMRSSFTSIVRESGDQPVPEDVEGDLLHRGSSGGGGAAQAAGGISTSTFE